MIPSFEQRRCVGLHLRAFDADAPDTSRQDATAARAQALSEEQWAFARQVWADSAPEREAATRRADAIADQQIASARKQDGYADEAAAAYRDTFRPIEQKIAADASSYDTPERRAAAAAAAGAGVEQQIGMQRAASGRALERQGVDPSSGKALGLAAQLDLGAAAAKAGAATAAERQVATVGAAKLADAANLGRGIASSQATQAELAAQLGTSGVGNGLSAINATTAGSGQVLQGGSSAIGGLSTAGNIYANSTAAQTAAANNSASNFAAGLGAVGSLIGRIYGSDENEKENVVPVDGEEALEAVRKMPVGLWNYRKDSKYADGGRRHIGPMAQDAHAAGGDALAPGGKVIDAISANGLLLSAVQALDRKIGGLADMVSPGSEHGTSSRRPGARMPTLADARRN